MSTLLMRLTAPMQSWGVTSKFDTRRTAREPTKSGVIGLVAAAMGIRRGEDEALVELSAMRFGVRVDREGKMLRDYHTAKSETSSYATAKSATSPYVTARYYLADAAFVVGLESDNEALLRRIEEALAHPAFPLYLGRRSCPPIGRICLGVADAPLEQALTAVPPQAARGAGALRLVMDAPEGMIGSIARDVPVSFNPTHRRYAFRRVTEREITPDAGNTDHDPMAELE